MALSGENAAQQSLDVVHGDVAIEEGFGALGGHLDGVERLVELVGKVHGVHGTFLVVVRAFDDQTNEGADLEGIPLVLAGRLRG